jgi:hypothetical protein
MIGHNNPPPDYDGSPKDIFLAFVVHVLTHKYEKLIGHTIAYFMDDEGNCDITIPDLIKYSGIEDARTLNKYIKNIEHKKALEAERRRGKRNQYKMVAEYIQIALQDARVDVAKTTLSTEKAPTSYATTSHDVPTSYATTSHDVPTSDVGTLDVKLPTSDVSTSQKSHARANIDNNNINIYNNNQLASNARAHEDAITSLNGNASHFVNMLAGWLSRGVLPPDPKKAEDFLRSLTSTYNVAIVKKAMVDTHGKVAEGEILTNPISFLRGACQRLSDDGFGLKKQQSIGRPGR